jgi:signal transduction histidine kinase/ActR/RegA family two-component response regulator
VFPTSQPSASLEDIVITPLLTTRAAPPRDIAAEHTALNDLIRHAAICADSLLPRLVELAVQLCDAGSAGVSLLERSNTGDGVFRWVAMAGAYREYVGGTTPESFSPCGTCLARGTAQLYHYPARLFTYLSQAAPPIVEGLVLPLQSEGGPLGTIWIVSHDEARTFSARDVEVMSSLADFTSAALTLQRAKDEAESVNRVKDEFLAVVSHELRRPLTAIVGWSEVLLAGRATPEIAARAIEALYANARRQQNMIEDLLDTSRAATGRLTLDERVTDLTAVVRSAIEMVGDTAASRGVIVTAEIEGHVSLHGDAERLHQVVANLLQNAIKFTPRGGSVAVALRRAGAWVEIHVADTGIGIGADMIPVIFDAFRTGDASSTRRQGGLGLGLTIARRLTALHDGSIEVRSEGTDKGATFIVRVPASRLVGKSATRPREEVLTKRSLQLAGLSVLVVDDEPDVRDILACVLEEAGAMVVSADGVDGALSAIAGQTFDVLVTDLVMPERDGYDLVARLGQEAHAERPRTIIAVTALASSRERVRALAAGFDYHLAKPVDFSLLIRLIVESSRAVEAH